MTQELDFSETCNFCRKSQVKIAHANECDFCQNSKNLFFLAIFEPFREFLTRQDLFLKNWDSPTIFTL